jgi:hypothetical protein
VCAERGDRCAAHFHVFACRFISTDVGGSLITQGLVGGALAGDGRLPC